MKVIVIGCKKYYKQTFSELLQERMVFYDHIGCRKDDTSECSLELILNDINSFQDSLFLDKDVVIGHSIHAYIATEYTKKFPDRIDKVVLIGCGPYTDFNAADEYFAEFATQDRKDILCHNLNLPSGYFSSDHFIDKMLRFAPMLWYDYNYDAKKFWEDVEINHRAVNIIWGEMFQGYKIEKLTHPKLVIIGRYDFFNPPNLWSDAKDILIFERSGHTPQIEERERFDREFLKFLTKN